MIVSRMEIAGEGALQKKFLALKAALEKEGLFREDRKRSLPVLPRAVGIVTSATGAAIHDMVVKLNERMPSLKKYLFDARVQGDGSAHEIAAGIEFFNATGLVDVIIIGRGGGSLEDLWAFNEEVLVRAVFASRVPIISGVGHEVDIALTDLAADVRAPTPTAAAEIVVPHREDLLKHLLELYRRLSDTDRWLRPLQQSLDELQFTLDAAMRRRLDRGQIQLETAQSKVKSIEPFHRIGAFQQRLNELEHRLESLTATRMRDRRLEMDRAATGLDLGREYRRIDARRDSLRTLETELESVMRRRFLDARRSLKSQEDLLESLSHKRVLDRGYALIQRGGKILRSTKELQLDEAVAVRLARGSFHATVSDIQHEQGEDNE